MINIVEFLAKKHQELKKYPLITLEDLYNAEEYRVLFVYLFEYATRKVLEGYIISTDKWDIIDLTNTSEFITGDRWEASVQDKVKKIIDDKVPDNNVDFLHNEKGKEWVLLVSVLRGNTKGHDDQKYYDIR